MPSANERLLGRQPELAAVDALLRPDSPVRVLAFWGPPGVGKSTLLRQIRDQTAGWRVQLLDIESLNLGMDHSDAHAVAADSLLLSLARILISGANGLRDRTRTRKTEAFEQQIILLGRQHMSSSDRIRVRQSAWLGGQLGESSIHVNNPTPALTEAKLAYRRAVVRALLNLARSLNLSRNLLLVDTAELLRLLDQVGLDRMRMRSENRLGVTQWFLRELIPELLQVAPGLRIVVAGREKLSVGSKWFRQEQIKEWTSAETTKYFDMCGCNDPELADVVHELCAGIPLWIAMVVEACEQVSKKAISPEWLRAVAYGRPSEQWLPEMFLARLQAEQRQIVSCAAVPRHMNLELIERLLQVSSIDIPLDWWDHLLKHSFIRSANGNGMDGGPLYMHRLVRAALLTHLDQQEPTRLARMHNEAANYFSQRSLDVEEIYHRFALGEYSYIERWRTALARARRHHDVDSVVRLLDCVISPEQAIRISRSSPQLMVEGEYQRALLTYTMDRLEAALEQFKSALRGFEKLGDDSGISRSHRWCAILLCYLGNYTDAEGSAQRALAAARAADDVRLALDAHSVIAMNYAGWGRWRRAIAHYSATVRLARTLRDFDEQSNTLSQLSGLLLGLGRTVDAARYLDLAESIARTTNSATELALCLYTRGWHLIYLGDPAGAIEPLELSVHITRQQHNLRDIGWSLRPLVTAYLLVGRYRDAQQCTAEALDIFDQLGDRSGYYHMLGLQALIALSNGQRHHATPVTKAVESFLTDHRPDFTLGWVRLVCGAVMAVGGEPEWRDQLRATMSKVQYRPQPAYDFVIVADALIRQEEYAIARTFLHCALLCARRADTPGVSSLIRRRLASIATRTVASGDARSPTSASPDGEMEATKCSSQDTNSSTANASASQRHGAT